MTTQKKLDLATINSFYQHFAAQAISARSRQKLTPQEKRLIDRLTANQIAQNEKEHVLKLLATNELAMEYLQRKAGKSQNSSTEKS